jgi:hypothetical protein
VYHVFDVIQTCLYIHKDTYCIRIYIHTYDIYTYIYIYVHARSRMYDDSYHNLYHVFDVTHKYVCIYIKIHTCKRIYIPYTYIHIYMYIHIYIYTRSSMHNDSYRNLYHVFDVMHKYVCMYIKIHTCTRICIHTYHTYTYIHIYMNVCIHVYTHTHTHIRSRMYDNSYRNFYHVFDVTHIYTLIYTYVYYYIYIHIHTYARCRMYDNSYHNFYHVFDVTQTVFVLGTRSGIIACLTPMERFALVVAALCHDLEHPGVNNMRLIQKAKQLRCVCACVCDE